jgi:DNA-binding IclR family transcriptional regulator
MVRIVDEGGPRIDASLQVLHRAFMILDLFTPEEPEWTTSQIARRCDLPIATAHRLLAALQRLEVVTRDPDTKRFRLGMAALRLGESARHAIDLRAIALPVLTRLAEETGETALLTVLNEARDHSLCLERIESAQPLRLSVQPGRMLPLHAGASQKVLLAFMPERERERMLLGPLERLDRATIVEPDALRTELELIRERGYAVSAEETNAGVWGMAVPILDHPAGRRDHSQKSVDGIIVAGLGFAGPLARRKVDLAAHHLACLRRGAAEIARALGLQVRENLEEAMDATGTEG